jgi:GAF domain-containing protein/ANTAR domain-containing protein
MTTHRPGDSPPVDAGPLARCLGELAELPDDAPALDAQLAMIALLSVDRIGAVDYASITALRGGYVTVAASNELALAVDEAQYSEGDGPCIDSVDTGEPISVPDIGAVIRWPGFRDAAYRMGLRASLSIPLVAGSGTTVAALNLYGRDIDAMAPLTEAVLAVYTGEPPRDSLDPGSRELVIGLSEAQAVCAVIQRAIGVLIGRDRSTATEAYDHLRVRAASNGETLSGTAAAVLADLKGTR